MKKIKSRNSKWNSSTRARYCVPFSGQSSEGDVRLRRGDSTASGYVEIYHNGIWGRVCDTGWTHENAHVTCKQLGEVFLFCFVLFCFVFLSFPFFFNIIVENGISIYLSWYSLVITYITDAVG